MLQALGKNLIVPQKAKHSTHRDTPRTAEHTYSHRNPGSSEPYDPQQSKMGSNAHQPKSGQANCGIATQWVLFSHVSTEALTARKIPTNTTQSERSQTKKKARYLKSVVIPLTNIQNRQTHRQKADCNCQGPGEEGNGTQGFILESSKHPGIRLILAQACKYTKNH